MKMLSRIKVGDYLGALEYRDDLYCLDRINLIKVKQIVKTDTEVVYVVSDNTEGNYTSSGVSNRDYGSKFVKVSENRVKVGDNVRVYFRSDTLNNASKFQSIVVKVEEVSVFNFKVGEDCVLNFNDEGTSWEKVE